MRETLKYETKEQRETAILTMAAQGYKLIEDCIHFEGNYLTFEYDAKIELGAFKARVEATLTDHDQRLKKNLGGHVR